MAELSVVGAGDGPRRDDEHPVRRETDLLAFKGVLAQFFGLNLTWRPIRALPAAIEAEEADATVSVRR